MLYVFVLLLHCGYSISHYVSLHLHFTEAYFTSEAYVFSLGAILVVHRTRGDISCTISDESLLFCPAAF